MSPFRRVQNLFSKASAQDKKPSILSIKEQAKIWRRADHKMRWNIGSDKFEQLEESSAPSPTDNDRRHGFIGFVLFYGFGDDGRGNADAVLSGQQAWDYALQGRKTWQCEYINFNKPMNKDNSKLPLLC